MKRPYEIQFVKLVERRDWFLIPDAYEVRKDFRWKWQERLARWLFRKLGTDARDLSVKIERVLINPSGIMDAIYKQTKEHVRWDREPKRVLIGSDDFSELMGTAKFEQACAIECDYKIGGQHGYKICGLTVEVIPWMRGILVMP